MSPDAVSGTRHGESFNSHEIVEGDKAGGLILLCDHASNRLPARYGDLGVPASDLNRHIGFDIGAGALTRMLAKRFRAPAILSSFSRLLIDPNRGEDDPTLIMRLSDGSIIPGNANVDDLERERRLNQYYRPYHRAIEEMIDDCLSERPPVLFSIHSYVDVWRGSQRPWHCGMLWDKDPRFAVPVIERLRQEPGLFVGDNEPYKGCLKNDTMYRHGTCKGLAHGLLEVRNDLIADPAGILEWADRIETVLRDVLADEALYEVHFYGSLSDEPLRPIDITGLTRSRSDEESDNGTKHANRA